MANNPNRSANIPRRPANNRHSAAVTIRRSSGSWIVQLTDQLKLAAELGATPKLARSLSEPLDRYRAMMAVIGG
jgi:hypothetical protein